MTSSDHLAIAAGVDVVHELEVKRSRFLCVIRRAPDEAAARALLTELRSAHHAARHHCFAYVGGPDRQWQRSSDDGEPAGTAGMPMLQALLRPIGAADPTPNSRAAGPSADRPSDAPGPLSDVTAVVVRYFGGTLLGTGGLTRAYAAAVTGALRQATFVRHQRRRLYRLTLDHDVAGRIVHELHATDATVRSDAYDANGVILVVSVADSPEAATRFRRWRHERRLDAEEAGTEWLDVPVTG